MAEFTGRQKKYYDALVQARELVLGQIEFHANETIKGDGDRKAMATHMADLGSDNSRLEMELQLLTEEGNVQELIDEAIMRLHSGEYGHCLDCGDPIPDGRLEVKPYACYCIKCKSIREQNNGINPYID